MPPDVKGRPPAGNRKGGPKADAHASEIDKPMLPRRVFGRAEALLAEPLPLRWTYATDDLPSHLASRLQLLPTSRCWLWTGPTDRDGYGRFRGRGVHRAVWEVLVGNVPPGMVLDHREDWGCTSRACCNPAHLLAVTPRVNILRGRSFAAINAAKIRCIHGHPFSERNTYIRPNGHRDCRICGADRARRYQLRLRVAPEQETLLRAA